MPIFLCCQYAVKVILLMQFKKNFKFYIFLFTTFDLSTKIEGVISK